MPHIPLNQALICLDCDMIGNNPGMCLVCTSKAVWPLSTFLNRPEAKAILTVEKMTLLVDNLPQMGDRLPLGMMPDIEDCQA